MTVFESTRVAMYAQGMVGFGHIRRNASIAQALRQSEARPAIVMIAEAWQAGAIPMPAGADFVTLPALRRGVDGSYNARFLDVSDRALIALRAKVVRSTIEAFAPDVLIVDHWPLGAALELARTLSHVHKQGGTRCVLGLRDVLYDAETTRRFWGDDTNLDAIREYYDAVWIYGDPTVYDAVREYDLPPDIAEKVRFTGYLDQRPRLQLAQSSAGASVGPVPPGRLALCLVGGGQDGDALVEAFFQADLPPDVSGVVVTGPLMAREARQRLRRVAARRPRFTVLDFVPDTTPLMQRADRVIAMGGYNTVCEVLSFEKHALIVPRVQPEPEQWIRAQRLRELGLVHVLHPDDLCPRALTEWLAQDLGPAPAPRQRIDLGGLTRIPGLFCELLGEAPVCDTPAGGLPVAVRYA